MASRLAAAALAVALLGCAEPEKKRGADDGEAVIRLDQPSSADVEGAADDFGRRVSERQAAGAPLPAEVRTGPVENGIPGWDAAPLQRAIERRLAEAGVAVKADAPALLTIGVDRESLDGASRFGISATITEANGHVAVSSRSAFTHMSAPSGEE